MIVGFGLSIIGLLNTVLLLRGHYFKMQNLVILLSSVAYVLALIIFDLFALKPYQD